MDDIGDDEEDTTSSDADDMDDDDDVPGMFRIHDNLSPPPVDIGSDEGPDAPSDPTLSSDVRPVVISTDSPPSPDADIAVGDHLSNSSASSSDSSVTVTLNGADAQTTAPMESGDTQLSSSRISSRPTRTIVGRHTTAPRPGMSPQSVRVAYINTAGRPVYSGRLDSGSVSPTSRAFIDAALQSPTGQVQLEIPHTEESSGDNDHNDEIHDRAVPSQQTTRVGRLTPATRPFSGAASDISLSQFRQMVAATGHIVPSVSSAQIDNLIESVHLAQRVHAARAAVSEELVNALSEASPSNITPVASASTDSNPPINETADEAL